VQSVRGLRIIAFIDDLTPTDIDNFTSDLYRSHATGLRVSVHDRGSNPSMPYGVTINPGTETTVWVTQTRVERLPSPWEGCSSTQSTSYSPERRFDEVTLSSDACIEVCAQNQVSVSHTLCCTYHIFVLLARCVVFIYLFIYLKLSVYTYKTVGSRHKHTNIHDSTTPRPNGTNRRTCS